MRRVKLLKKGKGEMVEFQLVDADTLDYMGMYFSDKQSAQVYINKKGYKLVESKMKRSTELKLRKLIERIIREETNKKSLREKISKKDMKLMLDSGNTFRDGKVTAVKDKGRYWITLDTPQYKGSRIYNNDNFEEFHKQITAYIRQYNK